MWKGNHIRKLSLFTVLSVGKTATCFQPPYPLLVLSFTQHHSNHKKPRGGSHQSLLVYEAIQHASNRLIILFPLRYTSDTPKCLRSMMQLCLLLDAQCSCHPALQTHGLNSECAAASLSTRWATASVQISSPLKLQSLSLKLFPLLD